MQGYWHLCRSRGDVGPRDWLSSICFLCVMVCVCLLLHFRPHRPCHFTGSRLGLPGGQGRLMGCGMLESTPSCKASARATLGGARACCLAKSTASSLLGQARAAAGTAGATHSVTHARRPLTGLPKP